MRFTTTGPFGSGASAEHDQLPRLDPVATERSFTVSQSNVLRRSSTVATRRDTDMLPLAAEYPLLNMPIEFDRPRAKVLA
jgi:hypothetical protein